MKFIDLTGQKFGKLTVIERVEIPKKVKSKKPYFRCKCDCKDEYEVIVSGNNLRSGHTKSCGCLIKEKAEKRMIDLTGMVFGKLTVIRVDKNVHRDHNKIYWVCECSCVVGKTVVVSGNNLKNGNTRSCGCINDERVKKGFGKKLSDGESNFNSLYAQYVDSALRRCLNFNLSKDEFFILTKGNCHYCGKKPSQIKKQRRCNGEYVYNGIDRIDSLKGYFLDNCVSCCWRCNEGKMNLTQNDFYEWIISVYNHIFKNSSNEDYSI